MTTNIKEPHLTTGVRGWRLWVTESQSRGSVPEAGDGSRNANGAITTTNTFNSILAELLKPGLLISVLEAGLFP